MSGAVIEWMEGEGVWKCRITKQLGPGMFAVERTLTYEPTPAACWVHELIGLEELAASMRQKGVVIDHDR